jgi:DNA-binding transcriptional MerR regulator
VPRDSAATQRTEDADPTDEAEVGPCGRPLTTGDLARACDTTVRTVRFYEEAGVLCPETRSEGGHRLFGKANLQKLQLIMDLREAGLSLNDIRALFELKRDCASPEEASEAMSKSLESQIEEMQRKIAVLRRLREELASTVAIIQECRTCDSAEFPKRCCDCDVMNRPDLPRAMRLLWGCED